MEMESVSEIVTDHQQQQSNGIENGKETTSNTATSSTSHNDEMCSYEQQRQYPQHDNDETGGSRGHVVASAASPVIASHANTSTVTNAFPSGLSALIMAATSQLNYLADAACSREKEEEQIVIASTTTTSNTQYVQQHQQQPNGMMLPRNELESYSHIPILYSHSERNYTNTNASGMVPSNSSIGFDQSNRSFQNRTQSSNYAHHPSHRSASVQNPAAQVGTTVPSTSSTGTAIPPNETTPTIMPESVPTRKLTFPETLMTLAMRPENIDTITFLPDGKFFAICPDTFIEQILLGNHLDSFFIHAYDRFLDVLNEWGYTSVLDPATTTDVAVFRHPQFKKGEWDLCRHMHSSTDHTHTVRFQSLNEYRGIDGHRTMSSSTTDDSASTSVSAIGLQQHQQPTHPTTFRPSTSTTYGSHHTTDGNNTSDDGSSHILDSDNCQNASTTSSTTSHPKRRLSPSSSVARPDSTSSVSSQKQKIESEEEVHSDVSSIHGRRATHSVGSVDESETVAGTSAAGSDDTSPHPQGSSYGTNQLDDAVRSKALAITTDKLQLHHQSHSRRNSLLLGSSRNDTASTDVHMDDILDCKPPLIDQAVSSATHSIVTNAIATLLRDESHTKETYLKHEKELSKSCIPGVIPISTQLFSPGLTEPLTTTTLRSTASLTSIRHPSNEEEFPSLNRSVTLPFTSSVNSHFVPTSHRASAVMRRNSLHSYDPTGYQRMSSSTPGDFIHSTANSTPLASYSSSNLASNGVNFSHLQANDNGTLHWRSKNNGDVATRRSSLPTRTSPSSNELSLNDQVAGIESLMNLKHHFSSGHVRGLSSSSSLGGTSTSTYLPNMNSADIAATSTSHRTGGITDRTTIVEGQSISRTVTGDLHFLKNSS